MDDTSQFQRLGFNVLLVFIFLVFSRIFDVKFGGLHITGIAYRIVFAMVLLSRGFQVALKTNVGKALLGFTIFMGLSVPFSVWRTGSKDIFQNQLAGVLFRRVSLGRGPGPQLQSMAQAIQDPSRTRCWFSRLSRMSLEFRTMAVFSWSRESSAIPMRWRKRCSSASLYGAS